MHGTFLLRQKARGLSIPVPETVKDKEIEIDDERKNELRERLQNGDTSVKDELVLSHLRLAYNISAKYARFEPNKSDEILSTAFEALVDACNSVANGALKDSNITGYLACRIHTRCCDFVRNDRLFGPSYPTIKKHQEPGRPFQKPLRFNLDLDVKSSQSTETDDVEELKLFDVTSDRRFFSTLTGIKRDYPSTREDVNRLTEYEISDLIKGLVKTRREKIILEMKIDGYKIQEIAAHLEVTRQTVRRELENLRMRAQKEWE